VPNLAQLLKILGPVAALACAPKEAADPHEMLAEDYERAGAGEPEGGEPVPAAAATRAECERAVRHVYALGGGAPESAEGKAHLKDSTDECLARGTSQREARCIATIRSEAEIERCSE
jgi:hypothetical protein